MGSLGPYQPQLGGKAAASAPHRTASLPSPLQLQQMPRSLDKANSTRVCEPCWAWGGDPARKAAQGGEKGETPGYPYWGFWHQDDS